MCSNYYINYDELLRDNECWCPLGDEYSTTDRDKAKLDFASLILDHLKKELDLAISKPDFNGSIKITLEHRLW